MPSPGLFDREPNSRFLTLPPVQISENKKPKHHNGHASIKTRLLFLSRIHEKKGLELLFDALAKLPFEWSLDIAGDGEADYIEQLKTYSQNLGIALKINWLGWIKASDRWAIFQSADLLVLPSHNENFANVVIESLAVGTPVLVSRHVGLSDYVLEKNMGWVCDTTAESIREKLAEAIAQNAKRQQISERSGGQIRQDFDPSVLVSRYLDMYQKVRK